MTVEEADRFYNDDAPVLVVKIEGETHVYDIFTLLEYEVVNDRIGGQPVFAAYCLSAGSGAIYDRQYGDYELTFAVSGYTYREPEVWEGKRAFLLWDRETESLWWPPIGRAVSGSLNETPLKLLDLALWAQTTRGEVKRLHPNAQVFESHVEFTPPTEWPRLDIDASDLVGKGVTTRPASDERDSIAPKWGENNSLGDH